MSRAQLGTYLEGRGSLTIDIPRLVETRMLIQANAGGGKSYAIRKLLEETHGKVQQIVLDVEGEFSTLREKYDFLLAGKGHDVPADPRTAELLARKVLELEASLIVDLYELKHHERIRFVRLFLEAMINAPKELWHPVLVVLDEAHLFAPEKGQSEAMSAVIDLASRGRKRGYAAVLATQRISKLHKDAAAECMNKLIGRTGLDIDMKRAAEELGFSTKQQMLGLRDLDPGQFYAFGPALTKAVTLSAIGEVATTHPKAGQRLKMRAPVPTAKVKHILAKLTDLPAQAEAELRDKESMIVRIRELEREARELKKGVPKKDPDAEKRAFAAGQQAVMKEVQKMNQAIQAWGTKVAQKARELADLTRTMPTMNPPVFAASKHRLDPLPSRPSPGNLKVTHAPPKGDAGDVTLGRSERKILKFLALRAGKSFTSAQVGALTGFKHTGGSFNTYLSRLRAAGLVEGSRGEIRCADELRAADILGADYSAPEKSQLEEWLNNLGGGEKKIYEVVLANPDVTFSKEDLGAQVEMEPSGGSFNTYLSRLSTLGLIERKGNAVRLNPEVRDL